jgi:hypothetical protein
MAPVCRPSRVSSSSLRDECVLEGGMYGLQVHLGGMENHDPKPK